MCWISRINEEHREASKRGPGEPCATTTRWHVPTELAAAWESAIHIQGAWDDHEQLPARARPWRVRESLRWLLGGWHSGGSQAAVWVFQPGCQGVPLRGRISSEFASKEFFFRNVTAILQEFEQSWSLVQAQILTRIHHRNLVSMIGYCKDGQYMALVYEYMSEGTLHEQIAGSSSDQIVLSH